jgi:hypothetical protein
MPVVARRRPWSKSVSDSVDPTAKKRLGHLGQSQQQNRIRMGTLHLDRHDWRLSLWIPN